MPLWTDSFVADTTHMSATEIGALTLLMVAMWRAGGELPGDHRVLAKYARLTPGQFARVWQTIQPRFRPAGGGGITSDTLLKSLEEVRRRSRRASDNANRRWLKTRGQTHANAYPNRMPDLTNQNQIDKITESEQDAARGKGQARKQESASSPIEIPISPELRVLITRRRP